MHSGVPVCMAAESRSWWKKWLGVWATMWCLAECLLCTACWQRRGRSENYNTDMPPYSQWFCSKTPPARPNGYLKSQMWVNACPHCPGATPRSEGKKSSASLSSRREYEFNRGQRHPSPASAGLKLSHMVQSMWCLVSLNSFELYS